MTDWRSTAGVADTTDKVQVYTAQTLKQTWKEEAEELDLSVSNYVEELVQEARYLRDQGQLKLGDRRRVELLQKRIEELEQQVEDNDSNGSESSAKPRLVETENVEQVLTRQFQSFDEVVEALLQQDEFRNQLRQQIETELYGLGESAQAAYRRGYGWKKSGGDR
jgi:hypothetical protein